MLGSIVVTLIVELQSVKLMTVSYSVCDPGLHQLPGFHDVRGGSPRGGDGSDDCHDRCHHPQTPKSGCLEVGIVIRSTVLPRGGADEDAHRQLHLVHRLRDAHFSLQVSHADFSETIVTTPIFRKAAAWRSESSPRPLDSRCVLLLHLVHRLYVAYLSLRV